MVRNKNGSILIFSFWALMTLVMMGIGISRRVNAELSVVRYQLGKTRSRYAAFAGLFYALDQIRKKQMAPEAKRPDRAFAPGTLIEDRESLENVFLNHRLEGSVFDIQDGSRDQQPGFSDETGKINVNALTEINVDILISLLTNLGGPSDEAQVIAASVIDWKDSNDVVFREPFGAEQAYYDQLNTPYACKNQPFETLEELLLVRGMTHEIFESVRPYLTIYPVSGPLKVNLNTASEPVLRALAQAVIGPKTNTNMHDAEDFVRAIVDFRNGSDGVFRTDDDREVLLGQMSFTGPKLAIASALFSIQSQQAAFLRARIVGKDEANGITTTMDAVIKTDGLAVVFLQLE